jgi:hypothetical protein
MNAPSIRIAILEVLQGVKPYALPQPQLLADVNMRVRPALSLGDLVKHLTWLKAHEMIGFIADDLDPDNADARKWLIKEAGLTALQK